MKKHFTNFIYTLLVLLVGTSGLFAQSHYIWGGPGDKNSEFDGGLNDWTTNAIAPNENAVWEWKADAKADKGAYSKLAISVQMNSPSAGNGAALFDSDYYSNGGVSGDDGNGPAPATYENPQVSELISPVFSCENEPTVYLVFNQFYRRFLTATKTKVAVSVDGGNSYVGEIEFNEKIEIKGNVTSNSNVILDISEFAANKANVRIKFIFEAYYYFWMIDDVYVMRSLPAEPKIISAWYPVDAYRMPVNQVTAHPFNFKMDVANFGDEEISSLSAKVSVVNLSDETTFCERTIENILETPLQAGDTLEAVEFESWTPTADMTPGFYVVSYRMAPPEGTSTLSNSGWGYDLYFVLKENKFSEIDGMDTIYRNSFDFVDGNGLYARAYGSASNYVIYINVFKMSDWADNDRITIAADSASYVITKGKPGEKYSYDSKVYLLKLADTIDDQLSNFDLDDGIEIDDETESKQLTWVGYSDQYLSDVEDWQDTYVDMVSEDEEGEVMPYVSLEPGEKYFLAMKWEGEDYTYQDADILTTYGSKNKYYSTLNGPSFVYGTSQEEDGSIVHGYSRVRTSEGDVFAWNMGLRLKIVHKKNVATKDELLPDNSVTFLGNPTTENLNVSISLEKSAEKASMVVSDINGKIIDMKTVYNLKDSNERFYVGNLPNGTYMFTLFTKDKFITKKFVVSK